MDYNKLIVEKLREKNINYIKQYEKLIKSLKPNELIKLKKTICTKKVSNKTILNALEDKFNKYEIDYLPKIKKVYKEDSSKVYARVKKHRLNSTKKSLQILLDENIIEMFNKRKKSSNLTSEELFKKLLFNPMR